ncbi:hypothetical protein ACFO5X_13895 [Seohaeicola nanhaiensis]|uniref:Oxidoreductase n=1 Tax=Seohaeicola nanhaiensis TaxID=1387282 RepID=A0ABV9KJ34_9RHOB
MAKLAVVARAGVQDDVFYGLGYSGHGAHLGTHMGQILARMATGDGEANPTAGMSWPAFPLYNGMPWFLPLVGAYYKMKDRIF